MNTQSIKNSPLQSPTMPLKGMQNLCKVCGKPAIRIRKSGLCLFCETESLAVTQEEVL